MHLSRKVLTYGVYMDCLGELLPGACGKPEACCFLHKPWSCQMMEPTDLLTAQHQFFQLLAAAQKANPARTMLALAHAITVPAHQLLAAAQKATLGFTTLNLMH